MQPVIPTLQRLRYVLISVVFLFFLSFLLTYFPNLQEYNKCSRKHGQHTNLKTKKVY